jgi:RHS repeat-associated protein
MKALRLLPPLGNSVTRFNCKTKSWSAALCAMGLVGMFLSALVSPLQAQSIDLEFQVFMLLSGTNGSFWTATLAGETISAGGVGTTADSCVVPVESERRKVRLELNTSYNLITRVDGCVCQDNGVGGVPLFTRIEFFGLTDCNWMRIGIGGSYSITNVAWLDETTCSSTVTWTISVSTNNGSIEFDACELGLPADGESIANARIVSSTLEPPIDWSIESPDLGCAIIEQSDYGCKVRAGKQAGTIQVIATGAHGCFTRASLDLFDPDDGPGCSSGCGKDKEIGDGDADMGSVDVSLFLGKSREGKSAGSLQLVADEPSGDLYSPKSLVYRWQRGDVAVVTDQDGAIHQVKAPQGLADVVVSSASLYTISFYRPAEFGIKTTNGYPLIGTPTPFAVWTIENPELTTTNRLRITQAPANQASVVHEYRWLTNGWELDSANGLRVKSRTYSYATNESGFVYEKVETTTTRQGANGVVAQHTRKWSLDPPDEYYVEETWGTGANARTNTYATDFMARQPGTVVRWDGSWNWYLYDSSRRMVTNFFSYLNQTLTTDPALCRMIIYDYSTNILSGSGDAGTINPFGPRSETEYIKGQAVSKRYHVYLPGEQREIQCLSTSAAWNDTANLVTTNKIYLDTLFSGRTRSVKRPDGTVDLYFYTTVDYTSGTYSNQQNVTNIVMSGQPDSYQTNIVDGTKTTTIVGPLGQVFSRTVVDIASQIVIGSETYSDFDEYDRGRKVSYLDGTFSYTDYACCGAQTVTNRDGIVTTYTRDPLKRVIAATVTTGAGSITTSNSFDAAGNVLAITRTGGSTITTGSATYDLAGRKLTSQDGLGNTTRFAESLPPLVLSSTNADGGTRIETRFRDGQIASATGTAAFPVRYEYGTVPDGGPQRAFIREIKLDSGGGDTLEYLTNFVDAIGRTYKTGFAGSTGPYRQSYFNNQGQLWKQRDPDGVITLYTNNARGELAHTCIDSNRDDIINSAGQDRITQTTNDVVANYSTSVLRTRTYVLDTHGSSTPTLLSSIEISVDGFKSWQTNAGVLSTSVKTLPSAGSYTVTQTAPEGTYSISLYQNGRLASVTRYDSGSTPIGKTTYGYDLHGRRNTSTDARTGTTTYTFNNADQIVSVTTPPPGTGAGAQTTTSYFDAMQRATSIVQPDGTTVNNVFSLRGELLRTSGSRNYPVGYSYDAQGRMKTMTNWSTFMSAGARVSTWNYHVERGWMTNKVDDLGKGTKYSYTAAGRLGTRLWARGTNTTYTYNNYGDLSGVSYDDGVTPSVSYTYTRRGQQENVTRGSDSWKLFYTAAGQLLSEAGTAGSLNGLRVTNAFDAFLRRTNVTAANGATLLTTNGYTYDVASRLSTAREGTFSATYSYLANSPLVSQLVLKSNTTVRLTTTKAYDNLNRLLNISSTTNTSTQPVFAYAYSYNDANQRTRVNFADGSFWIYEYDALGQVKSGKRYWSDWTPVAGQQFEYGFDDIGNRTSTKAGGDAVGASLRLANYTNNTLNQITGRDVPAYLNVIGAATATATNVNVNNVMAYRRGEYYRVELNPMNTSVAVWQSVTNRAVQSGTTNSVTGNMFLPKTAEVFGYDLDGNLTNDGRWAYVWDGENRLLSITSRPSSPAGSSNALRFAYDWQGRRISKTVSNYSGSAWSKVLDEKYLYDAWNLLSSLNASNSAVVLAFLWGTDLSGSMQGAGGVGGLLAVKAIGASGTFPAYDGNGNVTALVNAAGGDALANYEYGPFGELIRATGFAAKTNPFRFSTKFQDDETDLIYYGHRYYSANTGRWPSRDPLGEGRGLSLYAFVDNRPGDAIDLLGLAVIVEEATGASAPCCDKCKKKPKCVVLGRPRYTPSGTHVPKKGAGGEFYTEFDMHASFKHDPNSGACAACCEVRQWIMWKSNADNPGLAGPEGLPPPGWQPASEYHPDTWYEDRDSRFNHYGHRGSTVPELDEYLNANGTANSTCGTEYHGYDRPFSKADLKGWWKFLLTVVDTCNGNATVARSDILLLDW